VPATEGGATKIIDGREVYDFLAAEALEVLQEPLTPRPALFGRGAGHLGSVFEPVGSGAMHMHTKASLMARSGSTGSSRGAGLVGDRARRQLPQRLRRCCQVRTVTLLAPARISMS
jgi:hypothetical protein